MDADMSSEMSPMEYFRERLFRSEYFRERLFRSQPWQVMPPFFDFFAAALEGAPPEKMDEFFEYLRAGILGQIEQRRGRPDAV